MPCASTKSRPSDEADHAQQVERPELQAERVRLAVDEAGRVHPGAAEPRRRDVQVRQEHEAADARRPVERLVAGERQRRDPERGHVDRDLAGRLGGVDDQRARRARRRRRPISATGWIVPSTFEAWHMTTARVFGRRSAATASGSTKPRPSNGASVVGDDPALGEVVQRAQHGVVVETGRDDVVAGPDEPLDDRVERVRGVGGEDDPGRVRGAEEARDPGPGPLDEAAGLRREVVAAATRRRPDPRVRPPPSPGAPRVAWGSVVAALSR